GLPLARQAEESWVRWVGPQNVGLHQWGRGDLIRAGELFREARAVARAAGERVCEGISLGTLGFVAWSQGDFVEGRALAEESLQAFRQTGEEWAAISGLWVL